MRGQLKYGFVQFRRMIKLFLLFLILPEAGGQGLPARTPEVSASLDTTAILIGDQIQYRLEARVPRGYRVTFPELRDTLTPGVEILNVLRPDSQNVEDQYRLFRSTYLITSFDSGFHFIPAQPVRIEGNGIQDTLYTRSLPLEVFTLPPDTSITIYDIKAPYRAPLGFREILPYLGGGILALLLAYLALYFLKRRKRDLLQETAPVALEPAHIIALRELEELERQQLWQQGRVKAYYTRLTEILREYLERRYGIMAMEQTTSEIMRSLNNSPGISAGNRDELEQILLRADLVKFAKFLPDAADNSFSLSQALRFVQDTLAVDVHDPLQQEDEDEGQSTDYPVTKGDQTEKEVVK